MRFLLDMGISNLVGTWLNDCGFDTVHIRDNGLNRLEDSLIVEKAILENRIILTSDMDFGQIMAESSIDSISLIQFRVSDFTANNIIDKLKILFEEFAEQLNSAYLLPWRTIGSDLENYLSNVFHSINLLISSALCCLPCSSLSPKKAFTWLKCSL